MKKWWVKLLLVFGLILLALSTWFIGSGTQSRDAIERYRKQLLAAGEKLDVDAFIPVGVESGKNAAALFEKASWSITPRGAGLISTNPPGAMEIVAPGKARVLWRQDAIVWVKRAPHSTNTWADLELDLANQASAVDLLQQAAAYPDFDFGLDYHQSPIPRPPFSQLSQATALLSAKVIFDLHHGDTASAVTNLHALLMVANANKNDPMIVSLAMRSIEMQSAAAAQWELLQATNLTDEQLALLQTNWLGVDFVKSAETMFLMSRSLLGVTMKAARDRGATSIVGAPPSVSFSGGGFDDFKHFVRSIKVRAGDAFWRESWVYDDELKMLEGYSVMVETMRQVQTNGYFKGALAERERQITALGLDRTNANSLRVFLDGPIQEFDVARSIRSYAAMVDRVVAAEAWRQCTVAAIALKRYELRHGELPKELKALVPEFLPKAPSDPIDGHPLRYRVNADGSFLLYCIGADGNDDGGDATLNPSASLSFQWQACRDWVWPQPATLAEIKNYYDHPPK